MNHVAYSLRFSITSALFLSAGTILTSLSVNNIPLSVLATVLSWISGLCGRRRRNSLFICTSVRTLFSLIICSRQSCISSSTRMLFLPPRANSWILPSLIDRATIPCAVDLFTPNVSATSKSSSFSFSKACTIPCLCSCEILFRQNMFRLPSPTQYVIYIYSIMQIYVKAL